METDMTRPVDQENVTEESAVETPEVLPIRTKRSSHARRRRLGACCWGCIRSGPRALFWASEKIQEVLEGFYYRLGKVVAMFPLCFIVAVVLFSGVCAIGFLNFRIEARGHKLWAPTDSTASNDQTYYENYYGKGVRRNHIIITNGEAATEDTLTKTFLGHVFDLHDAIWALRVTHDGVTYGLNSTTNALCYKSDGTNCEIKSVLDAWDFDKSKMETETSDATAKSTISSQTNTWTGAYFNAAAVYAGTSGSGSTLSATVLKMQYQLHRDNQQTVDGADVDYPASAWEDLFISTAKSFDGVGGMKVYQAAEDSIDKALEEAINGDISLIALGYTLIISYATFMLGRLDCRNFKGFIALGGVASVGLAILTSFGLASGFGVFYGLLQSVLPFLLLGIGVDDMFVILKEFSMVDASLPPNERIARTMKHAGVSITITSVTDFTAFMIGATTRLPALRSFCIYAGLGILFDFIYQITFFVACLAIDTKRQAHGMAEGFPCAPALCVSCILPQSLKDRLDSENDVKLLRDIAHPKPSTKVLYPESDEEIGALPWWKKAYRETSSWYHGYRLKFFSFCVCCLPCLWPENHYGTYYEQLEKERPDFILDAGVDPRIPEMSKGAMTEWSEPSDVLDGDRNDEEYLKGVPALDLGGKADGAKGDIESSGKDDVESSDKSISSDDKPQHRINGVGFQWSWLSFGRVFLDYWFVRALSVPGLKGSNEVPMSRERRMATKDIYARMRQLEKKHGRAGRLGSKVLKKMWRFRPWSGKLFSRLIGEVYAPIVSHPAIRPMILLIAILLFGVTLWQATTMVQQFRLTIFIPDGNVLKDYYAMDDTYFQQGLYFNVVLKTHDVYAASQAGHLDTTSSMIESLSPLVQTNTLSFWYNNFKDYLNNKSLSVSTISSTQYYSELQTFLNDNPLFRDSIVFDGTSTESIITHQFGIQFVLMTKSADQVDALDTLRSKLSDIEDATNIETIAYSYAFLFWEQFKVIVAEMIQNVCLAMGAVLIVVLLLNAHPWVSILTTVEIGSTIVNMIGFSALWGLDIDSVFVINLVMAIGLSVDYSAHISHKFMHTEGTRAERARKTISTMGEGVLNGAISTFLAVLVLAFSASYVFRTFFKQLFLVVVCGVFHGLAVLPAILSYVGPAPLKKKVKPARVTSNEKVHPDDVDEPSPQKPKFKLTTQAK